MGEKKRKNRVTMQGSNPKQEWVSYLAGIAMGAGGGRGGQKRKSFTLEWRWRAVKDKKKRKCPLHDKVIVAKEKEGERQSNCRDSCWGIPVK